MHIKYFMKGKPIRIEFLEAVAPMADGDHDKTLNLDVSEVQLHFYDFANNYNASSAISQAKDIFDNYHLDVTKKLIFFVPGYKSHISRKTENLMRDTFKDVPNSYLMIVDHSVYTSARGGKIESYARSVRYAYYIAQVVADFLVVLYTKGYPASGMHCVGHSLGAQILGYAGNAFFGRTNKKIWRITGLDPAGPCFSNSFIEEQLRSGAAGYVEVYHCNAGGLGTTSALADIDFFFNDEGANQPHCGSAYIPVLGSSQVAKCNHKACVKYWTRTVEHPQWYLAWRCDSYRNFRKGRCAANEVTIAGYSNPGNSTGVFYVSTDGYGFTEP
ncbi:Lipase member H [Eumeta japonica]|uniref:Lipase member H n=1 Tax=Eumeta variegata TaxID=151549 RepID=A0A4C1X1A8_EUMVA|nr:Lipase member H [Eumeta japonica]